MSSVNYIDDDLIVVEKPAGISTQPLDVGARFTAPGRNKLRPYTETITLAHLVAERFPEIKTIGGADWGAVHRLDRDTSGLVVFARNEETYRRLREMFSKNEVEKEYMALVKGAIRKPGKIEWPIGPDPKTNKKVKVYRNLAEARRGKAQEAITIYAPVGAQFIAPCSDGRDESRPYTLLHIAIKTGRRHQIRAHLASIGHAIVGDVLYGGLKADRLFLHASRLKFRHPQDPRHRKWVEASSPAPFS